MNTLVHYMKTVQSLLEYPREQEWFEFKTNCFELNALGEYISALANAAAYHGNDFGYFVWGIEDKIHAIVGTDFDQTRGQTAARALAGYSKIRNDVLAKALNYMRFIEEWGSGLRRVNKVFADYGLRDISLEDAGFAVKMNVYRGRTSEKNAAYVALNVDDGVSELNDVALNVASNVALNHKLVALVKANPGINRMQLSEKLSVTTRTIDRVLVSLEDAVVRRGSKKTGGYYCKD